MNRHQLSSIWMNLILTWFGLGRIPFMPGTMGSLGALPFIWYFSALGPIALWAFTLLVGIGGFWVSKQYLIKHPQDADPSFIVIDEVLGQTIPFLWLPWTWKNALLVFILFRLFDIWKPGPIGWADRLKGSPSKNSISIMLDDILAGIAALFGVVIILHFS